MQHNLIGLAAASVMTFCATLTANEPVDYQVIARGINLGFYSSENTLTIENDSDFQAFCKLIRIPPQALKNQPDFNLVQCIAIAYQQSERQCGHTISSIVDVLGTICVEINFESITIEPGIIPAPGFVFQIVAIPRQSNPISFELSSTPTATLRPATNIGVHMPAGIRSVQTFDLLGRGINPSAAHAPTAVRIHRIDAHTASRVFLNNRR
jgi:hypothetical protein